MKLILILMSFLSSLFGSNAQKNDTIKILDPSAFKTAIHSKDVQLVDVRTPNEFNGGHIENAVNIDFFNQSDFISAVKKLDKEKPVYVYCRSGNRSQKAAHQLDSLGFKKIFDLKGGYLNW
ncbi:MAG: rhodanese-like domain-containing protein [Nonlabens sp.]|uniref:rhodanese-like domain-containing protein n=1 Tax=Nonlabens sp. TaxID=1888209 RepID=UPI00321C4A26